MRRLLVLLMITFSLSVAAADEPLNPTGFPYVFHMVQAKLWDQVLADDSTYFPPTYEADGFTHGTSNPAKLMNVANHFYPEVKGEWYCLRMTVESLAASGVTTIFEGTAPVGDIPPNFEGATDELFPHILGGIKPAAVLEAHTIVRAEDGTFLSVEGVTE
ncbi:DUF952 domain-containing protein [Congregibacter sp.]|nr:DUF952 domain-containing protein [Congregibacter sp.]MDA8962140.1 DUF952 domain-containing protein [Congregibacter sp.]